MSPLLTDAAIEVGNAVAKSILRIWTKDSTPAEDISSDLIDLLESKTSDRMAQRKGSRQFAAIADKISDRIILLLESEEVSIEGDKLITVVQTVAKTLNKSRISDNLLLEKNLQPRQLVDHIIATNPTGVQDFSDAETTLYEQIIKEACTYVVDISFQLPTFTERALADILKREDQVLDKVSQILDEIDTLRKQLDPFIEEHQFEIEYREAVARNLDVLQLIGVDASSNRRYQLSLAYITLSVEQKVAGSPTSSQVRITRSVDEALASSRRILIRGLAGSGKTTLLQNIAVRAATKSFEGPLVDWNRCIPFFIRLREYKSSNLPEPEEFPRSIARAIAGTMPNGWVDSILKSDRAIVLVDGVDEVSNSERKEVHAWLKKLVVSYKDARFVITSRPHAVEEGWMSHEAFSEAEVQPMELGDICEFIDHWHKAVGQALSIIEEEEKNELELLPKHLKEQVKNTRAIRTLATNPLLCAMLCVLNRIRRQNLPANRIELYNACCNLLLDRRDKDRHVILIDYPELNYDQKERFLKDLAYTMTQSNLSELAVSSVDDSFTRKIESMSNLSTSGTKVRKLLVERGNIIREPVAGKIDFAHRTFQEFLTAKAALDMKDVKTLVENAHNDQWREVIILAAGLARTQAECEELVKGLITRGDQEVRKERKCQLYLLAVSCLETAVELGLEVKKQVEQNLAKLVPPKDTADAKALAAAGELAIPYLTLTKNNKYSPKIKAACIHALANIGSSEVLGLLEEYANDEADKPDEEVTYQLLKAWDSFDRQDYVKRVLSKAFRNKSTINLARSSSIDGIQYLTNATELDLSGSTQLNDLTPLTSLVDLTSLNLEGCTQISNLTPLTGLKKLTTLNLAGCTRLINIPVSSWTNLVSLNMTGCTLVGGLKVVNLTNLTTLNLSACERMNSLNLSDLNKLPRLDLFNCLQIKNLTFEKQFTSLYELNLSGCKELTDLTPLKCLTNSTKLHLKGCSKINDLTPLGGLTNLTELHLKDCSQLSDLTPLGSLASLKVLYLSNCEKLSDLTPLKGLKSLSSLYLRNCPLLSDLTPLTNLTSLVTLDLARCTKLYNLGPIKSLTNLKKLYLSGCTQISDLTPLTSLTSLTELELRKCPQFSNLTVLSNMKNLTKVTVSPNMYGFLIIPQSLREKVTYWNLNSLLSLGDIEDHPF